MPISDVYGLDNTTYAPKPPSRQKSPISKLLGAAKDKGGDLWSLVDTPLSQRVGWRLPDDPLFFDEVGNWVLEEATRPINLAFGLGAPARAGARLGISKLLSPVVSGGPGRRIAGEVGIALADRGAARAAEELPESKFKTPLTIAAGLAGGIGGATALGRTLSKRPHKAFAPETDPWVIFDPEGEIERVSGVLVPYKYAPKDSDLDFWQANEGLEGLPQIASVDKARLQYGHPTTGWSAPSIVKTPVDEVAHDTVKKWLDGQVKPFQDLVDRVAKITDPDNDIYSHELDVLRSIYRFGQRFREALSPVQSADGTVTLYRGERRQITDKYGYKVHAHTGTGSTYSDLYPARAVQSYTTSGEFALKSATSYIGEASKEGRDFVIARRVPVSSILVAPLSNAYANEREIMALNHEIFTDEAWKAITAQPKPRDIDVSDFSDTIPALSALSPDELHELELAKKFGMKYRPTRADEERVATYATGKTSIPQDYDSYWSKAIKTGPQMGSNPGGKYTGPDGQEYYVKQYPNYKQAGAELAAQQVYRDLGLAVPEGEFVQFQPGKPAIANKWQELEQLEGNELRSALRADPQQAGRLFAAAIFTQNWDAVGLGWDNLVRNKETGQLVSVDLGGTFEFRAMGKHKPYTATADEFDTLLDPNINYYSATAFQGILDNPVAVNAMYDAVSTIYQNIPNYTKLTGISNFGLYDKVSDIINKLDQYDQAGKQAFKEPALVGAVASADKSDEIAKLHASSGMTEPFDFSKAVDEARANQVIAATGGGAGQPPVEPPTTTGGMLPEEPDPYAGLAAALSEAINGKHPPKQFADPDWESALMGMEEPKFVDGTFLSEYSSANLELQKLDRTATAMASKYLPFELQEAINKASSSREHPGFLGFLNQTLKAIWATADFSWFGIQGLMSLPRLAVTGQVGSINNIFRDAVTAWYDPNVAAITVNRMNEVAKKIGGPTVQELYKKGLHLSFIEGAVDIGGGFNRGPFAGANRSFGAAGDSARLASFYNEFRIHGKKANVEDIIKAVNRATGVSEAGILGDPVSRALLFAPRFLQSQLELVTKAAIDWRSMQGSLARRQIAAMAGTGVLTTFMLNEARGEETIWNPTDSNFMRVRNVAGNDISLFGPWDSLIRAAVALSSGDKEDAAYIIRSKASPLVSTAWNVLSGRDFMGDKITPDSFAKGLLLPFSFQDLGEEPLVGSVAGFFGVKSSPLSPIEILDNAMEREGLDYNDPLDRKAYLAANPDMLPKARGEDQELARTIEGDIALRQQHNDQLATSNQQTLEQWRESRRILQREQRNKLEVIFGNRDRKPRNEQDRWIQSYYELYDQARDPVTGDPNSELLDQLQATWLSNNGEEAYNYVNQYNMSGRSELDLEYLTAINQLRELNYFNLPRYRNMRSDLTDDQIQDARRRVSAARSIDPRLGALEYSAAVKRYLGSEMSAKQVRDVINAGKARFKNPELAAIEENYPQLTLWFNPNATYGNLKVLEDQVVLRQKRRAQLIAARQAVRA